MSEFHDPDLRQQLGRLSGPYPDDNAAFTAWQRRVGQARRRRAMAWTTGAALSLIIATVAVAAVQSPARHSVVPGKASETRAELTVSVASTEPEVTDPATTEPTAPETSAPTTLAPGTTPSSAVVAEGSMPEAQGDEGSGAQSGSGSSNQGDNGTPTSPPAARPQTGTQTFLSGGGSITVRRSGDKLTVVGSTPASGFRAEAGNRSGRTVKVTFKADNQEFRITVKLSGGVMKSSVSESGTDSLPRHQDTIPEDAGDNSGGGNRND